MNWPYWALDGSLTACASVSSWAAFLGVSQTRACTSRPDGTAVVCGAAVVHAGFDPCRTCRPEPNGPVVRAEAPAVVTSAAIITMPPIATTTRPRRIDGMCNSPRIVWSAGTDDAGCPILTDRGKPCNSDRGC